MKNKLKVLVVFLLLLSTFSHANTLKWSGCGITKKAFMHEAAKEYDKLNQVKFFISGGGATKGIRNVNKGSTDLGGNCRPILPKKYPALEGDSMMTLVAWDAIVPIVHQENPVDNISLSQLKDIMTGKITDWGTLGGPKGQKIDLAIRNGQSNGVGYMTRRILFNFKEIDIKKKSVEPYSKSARKMKSSGPLENFVQHNKWSFGVSGISSVKKKKVKILKLDGKSATVANIASGEYLTYRPLYLSTKGKPQGEIKKFLDWLLSDAGQKIIEAQGTVSVRQGKGLKGKFKFWEHTDKIVNFSSL